MSRNKGPSTEESAALHADAYQYQQGEFYPEHHRANVQRLREKYPTFSQSEIDGIYRQACHIDFEVRQRVGAAQLSEQAREELLEWLEDNFYGFSRQTFVLAVDRAEGK